MGVIRTWLCRQCQHEFDADIENPCCVKCGKGPAQWVPKGGHPLKVLRHKDRIMRGLAEEHGLTNMRSARAGESVMPTTPERKRDADYQFNGTNIPISSDGVTCQAVKVDKLSLDGMGLPQKAELPKLPSLREKTVIAAKWSDKGESRP